MGEKYSIGFKKPQDGIPTEITVKFPDIYCEFYIAQVNWDDLIPSLTTVESPLPVYEYQDLIFEKILYHPSTRRLEFFTKHSDIDFSKLKGAIKLSDKWIFQKEIGFYPEIIDPILKKQTLEKEEVTTMLYKHPRLLEKYLENSKVHEGICHPLYELCFDNEENFHINSYIFKPKDLQSNVSHRFGSWVFLQDKGFYQLGSVRFSKLKTTVGKREMSSFISQNRLWLNKFEGFQTHLTSIEIYYTYEIDHLKRLRFYSSSDAFENTQGAIDLGEWVYIERRGFYAKSSGRIQLSLKDFTMIRKEDVSRFIDTYEEDLEQVRDFFSPHQPVEKCGLSIELSEDKRVVVEPKFCFSKGYNIDRVTFFGGYTYVKSEGFSKLPAHAKIPEKYTKRTVLEKSEEHEFLTEELLQLKPFILHIDTELRYPKHLFLKVKGIERISKGPGKLWRFSLAYKSEFGSVDLHEIFKAYKEGKAKHVKTGAGLFSLYDSRLNWISQLSSSRFKKQESVDLNNLRMDASTSI